MNKDYVIDTQGNNFISKNVKHEVICVYVRASQVAQ